MMDKQSEKLDNKLLSGPSEDIGKHLLIGTRLHRPLPNRLLSSGLKTSNSLVNQQLNSTLSLKSGDFLKRHYTSCLPNRYLSKSSEAPKRLSTLEDGTQKNTIEDVDSDESLPNYCLKKWTQKTIIPKRTLQFDAANNVGKSFNVKNISKDIESAKLDLINLVSNSVLRSPNYKDRNDDSRNAIMNLSKKVAECDPEFILKLALYTRQELYIRSTANFLLAYASYDTDCRCYLKRYYNKAVNLPTDWIEVAEIYQYFDDSRLALHSVPTVLRNVMISKFSDFDQHQLAKYNRVKKKMPVKEDQSKKQCVTAADDDDNECGVMRTEEEESLNDKHARGKQFSLKQLIRLLHISDPVYPVMCLLGKKYPTTAEEFRRCRLPGLWDEDLAGKKMKLPTPDTWETRLSLWRNKTFAWEDLLEHGKVPFMAMLRNLRNIILVNLSKDCHEKVLNKITNVNAVAKSKQFPFQFLAAYSAIEDLANDNFKDKARKLADSKLPVGKMATWRKNRYLEIVRKIDLNEINRKMVKKYLKALKEAANISSANNIQPIKGVTVILLNGSVELDEVKKRFKAFPSDMQKCFKASAMLATMCLSKCENGILHMYPTKDPTKMHHLIDDDIFEHVKNLCQLRDEYCPESMYDEEECLKMLTASFLFPKDDQLKGNKIDNLIMLTGGSGSSNRKEKSILIPFLHSYRHKFNPDLLFVHIDVSADVVGADSARWSDHLNDVFISGFSDQVLRLIAERGNKGQLTIIENIDFRYGLKDTPQSLRQPSGKSSVQRQLVTLEKVLPPLKIPKWKTAQVFISSTFLDMYAERDLLVRFAFPELRERAKRIYVKLYEVDLRWGIAESQSRSGKLLEMCLAEVSKCEFFIGILGERYGWIPSSQDLPDKQEFNWVKDYLPGASITELEMYAAALSERSKHRENAFFFIRDPSFIKSMPPEWIEHFVESDSTNKQKLMNLKEKIKESGSEVFDGYPCEWGGVFNGKPIVNGLNPFGERVIQNLWTALRNSYEVEYVPVSELDHESNLHEDFSIRLNEEFVYPSKFEKHADHFKQIANGSGLLCITGKQGSGKTSLMAFLHQKLSQKHPSTIHFIGLTPNSDNVAALLRHICFDIITKLSLDVTIPDTYNDLVQAFFKLVSNAGAVSPTKRLFIFIDGLNLLSSEHQATDLSWLPNSIPSFVSVICSSTSDSELSKTISNLSKLVISLSPLELAVRQNIVNMILAKHGKVLDSSPFHNHLRLLTSKSDAGLPLYLELACQKLRHYGVHEDMSKILKSLSNTLKLLLQDMLKSLETEFGQDLVRVTLLFILISHKGLEKYELHQLLNLHLRLKNERVSLDRVKELVQSSIQIIAPAFFVHLIRMLEPFLIPLHQRNNILKFSHDGVVAAVILRYFQKSTSDELIYLNTILAGLYMIQVEKTLNSTIDEKYPRALSALPYHLSNSGCFEEVRKLLTKMEFIQAKFDLGLNDEILLDFAFNSNSSARFLQENLKKMLSSEIVVQFKSFLERNLHRLQSNPDLLLQLALNEPSDTQVYRSAQKIIMENVGLRDHALVWTNKRVNEDCQFTYSDYDMVPTCILAVPQSDLLLIGCSNGIIHLYNHHVKKKMKNFVGHSNSINRLKMINNDKFCSASKDTSLCIWAISSGQRLSILQCHSRDVIDCAVDTNRITIVSVGYDCKICIWNVSDGMLISKISSERFPHNCVEFYPSKQEVLIGGWDGLIKSWDLLKMKKKSTFRGHLSSVQSISIDSSGTTMATASMTEVFLWSLLNQTILHCQKLRSSQLLVSPCGQYLVANDKDKDCTLLFKPITNKQTFSHRRNSTVVGLILKDSCMFVAYQDGVIIYVNFIWDGNSTVITSEISRQVTTHAITTLSEIDGYFGNCYVGTDVGTILAIGTDSPTKMVVKSPINSLAKSPVTTLTINHPVLLIGHENGMITLYSLFSRMSDSSKVVQVCQGAVLAIKVITDSRYRELAAILGSDKVLKVFPVADLWEGITTPSRVFDQYQVEHIESIQTDNLTIACSDGSLKSADAYFQWKDFINLPYYPHSFSTVKNYSFIGRSDGSIEVFDKNGFPCTTISRCASGQNYLFAANVIGSSLGGYPPSETSDTNVSSRKSSNLAAEDTNVNTPQPRVIPRILVAAVTSFGTVSIFIPFTIDNISKFTGHLDKLNGLTLSTGNIFTSSVDKSIKIWNHNATQKINYDHSNSVEQVTICKGGTIAASLSFEDNKIRLILWDVMPTGSDSPTKIWINSLSQRGNGFGSLIYMSPHGSELLVCNCDRLKLMKTCGQKKAFINEFIVKDSDCLPTSYHYDTCCGLIFQGHYHGEIKAYRIINNSKIALAFSHKIDNHSVEKICVKGNEKQFQLFCVNNFARLNVLDVGNDKCNTSTVLKFSNIPVFKKKAGEASFPTAIAVSSQYLIIGNEEGEIVILNCEIPDERCQFQVHTMRVTECVVIHNSLFTSSLDGSVKIWKLTDQIDSLPQISQFDCYGPVTSMDACILKKTGTVQIIAGDKIGNVIFLKWTPFDTHLISALQ